MTRAVKGHIIDKKFAFPFRMILAGSSGAGKTYFAGKLLGRYDIFEDKISAVHYYFPCYLPEAPVNWHKTLTIPVSYHVGLPSKSDLMQLEEKCCVVIDDSFDDALKSSAIDHLFRVISGKRQISVMIMSQNNFSKGKYGREIRNSCNFSVLFRNCCDVSINENIARMAGMKKAYDSAVLDVQGQKYPYMLLDQSQKGQLSPYRLYTNIFDRFPVCYSVTGMKAYVVAAQDFEAFYNVFSIKDKFIANEWRESETKDRSKKICQTKKQKPINSVNLEWGSDSRSTSGTESNEEKCISPKTKKVKKKIPKNLGKHTKSKQRAKEADYQFEQSDKFEQYDQSFNFDERERIRRKFEETLY